MYRKAPTPAIKWKLFKRTHWLIGGRMDQDGRFADGIRRILDGLSDCFAIGQIAFEQPRVLIFLGQVLDIEHGYSGALGGKGRRAKPPNAPASAGKDYVLSVDAHFEPLLPWRLILK